jgi:hypothetical protein
MSASINNSSSLTPAGTGWVEWIGEATAVAPALGEDVDVVDAVGVEGGDRPPAGRSETDDGGPQTATVVAGATDELQGVED